MGSNLSQLVKVGRMIAKPILLILTLPINIAFSLVTSNQSIKDSVRSSLSGGSC